MRGHPVLALLAVPTLLLTCCEAQSLFGPIVPSGPVSECPLSAYERRAGEVQEVCCADGCPNGLPEQCNLDCAVRKGPLRPLVLLRVAPRFVDVECVADVALCGPRGCLARFLFGVF